MLNLPRHLVILFLALSLAACASPTPTLDTPTATDSPTRTLVPTNTVIPEPTLLPSQTPAPQISIPSCQAEDAILFAAADHSTGSDQIYQLCGEELILIKTSPTDHSIYGLDLGDSNRLLYVFAEFMLEDHLYIQASDNHTSVDVLQGTVFNPQWVLDDTHVIFVSTNADPTSLLVILNAEDQSQTTLFEEYTLHNLHVAPDGKTILFTASTGMPNIEPDTIVSSINCEPECQLTDIRYIPNVVSNPNWAENGTSIISVPYQEASSTTTLRITGLDGRIRQEITIPVDYDLGTPSEIIWTPSQVFFVAYPNSGDNIYSLNLIDNSLTRLTNFENTGIDFVNMYRSDGAPPND